MPDVALYTQTFPKNGAGKFTVADIKRIISAANPSTKLVFFISSLHFGRNDDGTAYLHLNDTDVHDLDYFFRALVPLHNGNVEFRMMLGGAGGAYNALYTDYSAFMNLLLYFLNKYSFISGIDLDIEEELHPNKDQALARVKQIINDVCSGTIKGFTITLAPIAGTLTTGSVGMGGFSYLELRRSPEWAKVEALNVQAYGEYDVRIFQRIVEAGFEPNELRMGMLGDEYQAANNFETALAEVEKIGRAYPAVRGAVLWETGDTKIDAALWTRAMQRVWKGVIKPAAFSRESAWNLW